MLLDPSGPKPHAKARIPTVRRERARVSEDGDQSWAVSYADLMMVLLSFFIIFFSLEPEKSQTVIQEIAMAANPGRGPASATGGSVAGQAAVPGSISSMSIAGVVAQTEANGERVLFRFPTGSFRVGGVHLKPEARAQLAQLAQALAPFQDKIRMTIVGHTDSTGVRTGTHSPYQNNFELSALRAAKIQTFLLTQGVDPRGVTISGSAEHEVADRTFTLVVEARGNARRKSDSGDTSL